jgi:hypothetical protein
MSQNVNKSNSITNSKNSVWNVEVGVLSQIENQPHKLIVETKFWKFKIILN